MTFHDTVRRRLLKDLSRRPSDEPGQLNNALRLLCKWRSELLRNLILREHGTAVMTGPFKGMDFLSRSTEGCHIAKLLGSYEQPLHPFIEQAIQTAYSIVVNIGCAEGYYAVGMARRMRAVRIRAHDLDPAAGRVCVELAARNGVADRVDVGALFKPEDFATLASERVLVLCDIEGGERELLNPDVAPALAAMDVIVESHECIVRGVTRLLIERFVDSHTITLVEDNGQRRLEGTPAWFNRLAHLDQLLATWEWRSGPTPWLVMKAKRER